MFFLSINGKKSFFLFLVFALSAPLFSVNELARSTEGRRLGVFSGFMTSMYRFFPSKIKHLFFGNKVEKKHKAIQEGNKELNKFLEVFENTSLDVEQTLRSNTVFTDSKPEEKIEFLNEVITRFIGKFNKLPSGQSKNNFKEKINITAKYMSQATKEFQLKLLLESLGEKHKKFKDSNSMEEKCSLGLHIADEICSLLEEIGAQKEENAENSRDAYQEKIIDDLLSLGSSVLKEMLEFSLTKFNDDTYFTDSKLEERILLLNEPIACFVCKFNKLSLGPLKNNVKEKINIAEKQMSQVMKKFQLKLFIKKLGEKHKKFKDSNSMEEKCSLGLHIADETCSLLEKIGAQKEENAENSRDAYQEEIIHNLLSLGSGVLKEMLEFSLTKFKNDTYESPEDIEKCLRERENIINAVIAKVSNLKKLAVVLTGQQNGFEKVYQAIKNLQSIQLQIVENQQLNNFSNALQQGTPSESINHPINIYTSTDESNGSFSVDSLFLSLSYVPEVQASSQENLYQEWPYFTENWQQSRQEAFLSESEFEELCQSNRKMHLEDEHELIKKFYFGSISSSELVELFKKLSAAQPEETELEQLARGTIDFTGESHIQVWFKKVLFCVGKLFYEQRRFEAISDCQDKITILEISIAMYETLSSFIESIAEQSSKNKFLLYFQRQPQEIKNVLTDLKEKLITEKQAPEASFILMSQETVNEQKFTPRDFGDGLNLFEEAAQIYGYRPGVNEEITLETVIYIMLSRHDEILQSNNAGRRIKWLGYANKIIKTREFKDSELEDLKEQFRAAINILESKN